MTKVDNKNVVKNKEYGKSTMENIISTIKPALHYENSFGIFRFRVVNKELEPNNKKVQVFGIVMVTLYFALYSMYINLPTAITGTMKLMDMMDEVPSMVTFTQYATATMTTLLLFSKKNIRIFAEFSRLDNILKIYACKDFYKKSRSATRMILIILTIYHGFLDVFDIATKGEVTVSDFIVLPIYFEQDLEITVFYITISMIRCRMKIINEYLTNFLRDRRTNKINVFIINDKDDDDQKKPDKIMNICDLAAAYDVIGGICGMINDVFNFQLFMSLVSTFVYIVITIWSTLYYFRTPEYQINAFFGIIIWCISAFITVAAMCFACERLLSVRNETKILVNEIIMDYDLPKITRVQAKSFMKVIDAWPLQIFVYDMFSVDITLMLKFISVATTYLIVIIQISHFI